MPQDHPIDEIPPALLALARDIGARSWETAKRIAVSRVGSVRRGERFPDDVADAVFLRLQRVAQLGTYPTEQDVAAMGRNALRLDGSGTIRLYRAAPRGGGIRPGDCAAGSADEAGFYRHGGNVVQSANVPRNDVIRIDGSVGGGQEYVYLPRGYAPPEPRSFFGSFRSFFEAASHLADRRIPEGTGPETDNGTEPPCSFRIR